MYGKKAMHSGDGGSLLLRTTAKPRMLGKAGAPYWRGSDNHCFGGNHTMNFEIRGSHGIGHLGEYWSLCSDSRGTRI